MKKRFHCVACGRKFRARAERQPYTKNGIRAACPEGHPVDESDIIPGRIAWCAKLPFKAVAGASMYPLFLAMQTVRRMCLGIKGAALWANEFANPWAKRDRAKAVTHEQLDHGLNSMAEFVRMVKNEKREEIEGVRASVSLRKRDATSRPSASLTCGCRWWGRAINSRAAIRIAMALPVQEKSTWSTRATRFRWSNPRNGMARGTTKWRSKGTSAKPKCS